MFIYVQRFQQSVRSTVEEFNMSSLLKEMKKVMEDTLHEKVEAIKVCST